MNNQPAQRKHKANPNYGKGVFRRRIVLTGTKHSVVAELEDCNHGFRLQITHDNNTVTALTAHTLRTPLTTCAQAVEPLQSIVGCPLSSSSSILKDFAKPKSNCTHMYDLVGLAIAHALRGNCTRQYDVEVPDAVSGNKTVLLKIDGDIIFQWEVDEHIIQAPVELTGKPLMKGFYQWASTTFTDEQWESAQVLQRGYFVSRARAIDLDASAGKPVTGDTHMLGMCFSYSKGIVEKAVRSHHSVRDFSDCPDQLLRFL